MRLCIKCKWVRTSFVYYSTNISTLYKCGYPEFSSLVTGEPIELCETLRNKNTHCGTSGVFWEKKDE